MFCTLFPKVTLVTFEHPLKALDGPTLPANMQLSALNTMDVRPVQFSNARFPMLVMLLGMVTDVSPVQPWKAYWPMDVTLSPIEMLFMEVLYEYHGTLEADE